MVSYIPERAPSSASSASTPSSPKVVNFAGVSGVSRPVTHSEQWTCYNFEIHAADCRQCNDPYARYKAGKKLCSEGSKLAVEVSGILYRKDGEVYSRVKEDGQKPRVEKPSQYDRSWSLLKAIEKGAKHKHPFLIANRKTSFDSGKRERKDSVSPQVQHVHPVLARKPSAPVETYERHPSYSLPLRHVHTQPSEASYTSAYTTSRPEANSFDYQQQDYHSSNRGSLYETELARIIDRQQREAQASYKLDVPEVIPERVPRLSARGSVRHKSRPQSGFYGF